MKRVAPAAKSAGDLVNGLNACRFPCQCWWLSDEERKPDHQHVQYLHTSNIKRKPRHIKGYAEV